MYSQLDITHARPMSYNYSDLQRVLEALLQMTKARLQESEAYNMRHSSDVDAFEIKEGIYKLELDYSLEWFIKMVCERLAFKARGKAEWFKCQPRAYNSNKAR